MVLYGNPFIVQATQNDRSFYDRPSGIYKPYSPPPLPPGAFSPFSFLGVTSVVIAQSKHVEGFEAMAFSLPQKPP